MKKQYDIHILVRLDEGDFEEGAFHKCLTELVQLVSKRATAKKNDYRDDDARQSARRLIQCAVSLLDNEENGDRATLMITDENKAYWIAPFESDSSMAQCPTNGVLCGIAPNPK